MFCLVGMLSILLLFFFRSTDTIPLLLRLLSDDACSWSWRVHMMDVSTCLS